MRSIFSLSDAGHSLVLILLFLALLFQLFVFCIGYFYRAKWTHCKMLSILAAISFLSLGFLAAGTDRHLMSPCGRLRENGWIFRQQ